MTPPMLAQALIAVASPARDHASVAGDLHEEFLLVADARGAAVARRWYWTQTLRSLPALLSYSRSAASPRRRVRVALISLGVLTAMTAASTVVSAICRHFFGVAETPVVLSIALVYADTVAFGAVLARLVRTDGVRAAFFASLFLVLCFVVPAIAGNPHSQAPPIAWIVLCGVVPTMCFGAGFYQAVRGSHA